MNLFSISPGIQSYIYNNHSDFSSVLEIKIHFVHTYLTRCQQIINQKDMHVKGKVI